MKKLLALILAACLLCSLACSALADSYTFSMNDGTDAAFAAGDYEADSRISDPGEPARDGYFFAGWFSDAAYTEMADFSYADDIWKDYGGYVRMRADETPGSYTDNSWEYNRFGDILVSRPYEEDDALRQDVTRSGGEYVFTADVLTGRGLDRLCGLYDSLRDRGVTVLISYAPVNRDGLAEISGAEAFEASFTQALAERGWTPISRLADYLLPGRYFYDSDYHLNEGGALVRTRLLLCDIVQTMRLAASP